MLKSAWRSVVYNVREGGVGLLTAKLFRRVLERLWSESTYLVYEVDLRTYDRQPRLPLKAQSMTLDDLRAHRYFKAISFPESIERRLQTGEVCHGFFWTGNGSGGSREALANVAWTSRDGLVLETGSWFLVSEGAVGIHDCFTEHAFRSMGIYTDTLVRLLVMARAEGVSRGLIAVDPDNRASIKGIERAGFVPLNRIERRQRLFRANVRTSFFGRQT